METHLLWMPLLHGLERDLFQVPTRVVPVDLLLRFSSCQGNSSSIGDHNIITAVG